MASSVGRSYASGVQISFGLVQITGNLYKPVTKDDTEQLKVVCPTCVKQMPQMYGCPDHGLMLPADTARAKKLEDDTLILMSAEQVAEAKESKLPEKLFELHIHPKEEVAPQLVNGEGMYVFLPAEIATTQFGILHDLIVAHPELVFIGMINLKKNDKLFRLDVGMNDQLVLQEVVWFSDVKAMPQISFDYTPKLYALAETLATSLVEPFDPEDYTRAARERMAAAITEAQGTPVTPGKAATRRTSAENLADQITAAIAATKPAKKAAKKPVRKAS